MITTGADMPVFTRNLFKIWRNLPLQHYEQYGRTIIGAARPFGSHR
jgi:hypothetical protein